MNQAPYREAPNRLIGVLVLFLNVSAGGSLKFNELQEDHRKCCIALDCGERGCEIREKSSGCSITQKQLWPYHMNFHEKPRNPG
jgi:hypothetical protein